MRSNDNRGIKAASWFYAQPGFHSSARNQHVAEPFRSIVNAASPEVPSADDQEWECPQCGETGGTPVDYDFGQSSETGYHDAGEACTKCIGGAK